MTVFVCIFNIVEHTYTFVQMTTVQTSQFQRDPFEYRHKNISQWKFNRKKYRECILKAERIKGQRVTLICLCTSCFFICNHPNAKSLRLTVLMSTRKKEQWHGEEDYHFPPSMFQCARHSWLCKQHMIAIASKQLLVMPLLFVCMFKYSLVYLRGQWSVSVWKSRTLDVISIECNSVWNHYL